MISRAALRSLLVSSLVFTAATSGSLPGPRGLATAEPVASSHYVMDSRVEPFEDFDEMLNDPFLAEVRDLVDSVLPLGWTPSTLDFEELLQTLDEHYAVHDGYDVKYTYRLLSDGNVVPVCRSRRVVTLTPDNNAMQFPYRVTLVESIGQ